MSYGQGLVPLFRQVDGPGTSFSFLVNGNEDRFYKIVFKIVNGFAGNTTYNIQLNGALVGSSIYQRYTSAATTQGLATAFEIANIASGQVGYGEFSMHAIANGQASRHAFSRISADDSIGFSDVSYSHKWADVVTNITSIGVTSSQVGGIGADSEFVFFRVG